MALIHRDFTRYSIYYISGSSPKKGVGQHAEIDCYTAAGDRAGAIYFLPDRSRLPSNQDTVNGIYLYYHMGRFPDVMGILREEKPLFLELDPTNNVGYLGTYYEPVGDQEGV